MNDVIGDLSVHDSSVIYSGPQGDDRTWLVEDAVGVELTVTAKCWRHDAHGRLVFLDGREIVCMVLVGPGFSVKRTDSAQ